MDSLLKGGLNEILRSFRLPNVAAISFAITRTNQKPTGYVGMRKLQDLLNVCKWCF